MKRYFIYIFSLSLFIGCYSSKKTISNQQINTLKKAVEESGYTVISDELNPIGLINAKGVENLLPRGSSLAGINLTDNPNYFKVQKDSVQLYLPYYGEQQMGGAYTSESGLTFKGIPDFVSKSFDSKKNKYEIKYRLNAENESLTANLTLYANNSSIIRINSSIRTPIIYYGKWTVIEEE